MSSCRRFDRNANGWIVDVELRGDDGSSREVHAQGPDPIDTARIAADRLLALLGKAPPAGSGGELSLDELEQRTEAAVAER